MLFDNLKVGDQVAQYQSIGFSGTGYYKFETVERMTKTLIITDQGRYRFKDGCSLNNTRYRIEPFQESFLEWNDKVNLMSSTLKQMDKLDDFRNYAKLNAFSKENLLHIHLLLKQVELKLQEVTNA